MIIYLDIIFIENLLMNYIILLATVIISKEKINQIRIIISSIIGSLYSVAYYLTKLPIFITIIAKITLSIVMIQILTNPKNIKELFKNLILFYLTSFAFGGCAFAILYYFKPTSIIQTTKNFIGIYPIKTAIIGGIIGFITINISFKLVKSKLSVKDMFCDVKIFNNGKERKIKAMIDTGNFLKDPITNSPVIVIEKRKLEELLPEEILENTNKIINGKIEITDNRYISKLRILPFSSLGNQNGLLLGFKAERVETKINNDYISRDDVIIGIYDKKLSANEKYYCLVGLNYLENN